MRRCAHDRIIANIFFRLHSQGRDEVPDSSWRRPSPPVGCSPI